MADLTQDVLLHLFSNGATTLLRWDPSAGSPLEGFVRLIARRRVAGILRSRRRTPLAVPGLDPERIDELPGLASYSIESELAGRERLEWLADRLRAEVSPRGFLLFQRLFLDMDSPRNVARAVGSSLASVYQWRSRLTKLIRSLGRLDRITA